jgi:hypothetical protein
MVIFRITLQLIGDQFFPGKLIDNLKSNSLVADFHDPGDKIWADKEETYDFGMVSILYPRTFGLQYDEEYQEWYIKFIEENSINLVENDVNDVRLFIEVFYDGQCNFEIFDKELIHRMSRCMKVSLPISIYHLKDEEIKEMLLEIGYTNEEIEEKG